MARYRQGPYIVEEVPLFSSVSMAALHPPNTLLLNYATTIEPSLSLG